MTIITAPITMTGKAANAASFAERDARVTVEGVEVACRFTIPEGKARGSVLLLPGSLYSDVDGDYPTMNIRPHVYADLAGQLGARGFAVLRMAKIGPGTGSKTVDAAKATRHADFLTRVEVAAAGLALLREMAPARPLIVAGHSEGAVVASLLAAGDDAGLIDGVVSLSGPSLPIFGIIREQVAAMTPPGAPADMTMFDRSVSAIRAGAPLPVGAATDPKTAMLAGMPPAAFAYLRSIDQVDPVVAIGYVRQPVLIVQGGRDTSVPPHHATALKAARQGLTTESVFFPELTHMYKVAPAGLAPMDAMGLTTDSDPAVADAIVAWANGLSA
jgi:pimeloyl-ACP methyl ester carboxylesterase